MLNQEEIIEPSNLETIDLAFKTFIEEMNLAASTNTGWRKVPVIWATSEKSFLVKSDEFLRDNDGTIRYPMITISRTQIEKTSDGKGTFYGSTGFFRRPSDGQYHRITKILNQKDTKKFANNDSKKKIDQVVGNGQEFFPRKNEKVVYETIFIPVPQHIVVHYDVKIFTEFVQNQNELTQPFLNFNGAIKSFAIKAEGHKYECFFEEIEDESSENELEKQREFISTIKFRVHGYIIGSGNNDEKPKIIKTQNSVEMKFPRERVMIGDFPETNPKSTYRP